MARAHAESLAPPPQRPPPFTFSGPSSPLSPGPTEAAVPRRCWPKERPPRAQATVRAAGLLAADCRPPATLAGPYPGRPTLPSAAALLPLQGGPTRVARPCHQRPSCCRSWGLGAATGRPSHGRRSCPWLPGRGPGRVVPPKRKHPVSFHPRGVGRGSSQPLHQCHSAAPRPQGAA
jgi:hypothetical protein